MECGGKTRKAQAEAEIAAAATTTSKGRNTGGERQEEEEIRSFDSLPLFSPILAGPSVQARSEKI
jgi:hypothetical protein